MKTRTEKDKILIKKSKKLNLVKVAILMVLSFGVYTVYLFFNNLQVLREYSKQKINKAMILLYFVPMVSYFFIWKISKQTTNMLKFDKVKANKTQCILLGSFIIVTALNRLTRNLEKGTGILISAIAIIVLTIVMISYQVLINDFLVKRKTAKYRVIYRSEIMFMLVAWLFLFIILSRAYII